MTSKDRTLLRESLRFIAEHPDALAGEVPTRLLRFWLRFPFERIQGAFRMYRVPQVTVFRFLLRCHHLRQGRPVVYVSSQRFWKELSSGRYAAIACGEGRFERLEPLRGNGPLLASEEEFADLFKTFHTFVRDTCRTRRPLAYPRWFLRRKWLEDMKIFAIDHYPRHFPVVACTRND